MARVKIHYAKTHLSRLIARACAGEEVTIARGDEPVVRLEPVTNKGRHRKPGSMKGRLRVDPEFFKPLSDYELKAWK
jgi:antitoxin (DNA-binding transcriptional repressor) of toxin-antitoxin stability system